MHDLKFGDIVEWVDDMNRPVRWMILVQDLKYRATYTAVWMVSQEDNQYGYDPGEVKRIGTSESNKVIRG